MQPLLKVQGIWFSTVFTLDMAQFYCRKTYFKYERHIFFHRVKLLLEII